jgi:hypothetical protein
LPKIRPAIVLSSAAQTLRKPTVVSGKKG